MHFFSLSEQSEKHHFGKSLRIPFSALYTYLPCIKSDLNRKKNVLALLWIRSLFETCFFLGTQIFLEKYEENFFTNYSHMISRVFCSLKKTEGVLWFLFLFCLRLFYKCPLLHRSDMIYYFQSISSLTRASQTKSRLNLGPYQYTV